MQLCTSLLLLVLLSFVSATGSSQVQVTIPNTFTDGEPAYASEVNTNFDAVKTAVNHNDSRTLAAADHTVDTGVTFINTNVDPPDLAMGTNPIAERRSRRPFRAL